MKIILQNLIVIFLLMPLLMNAQRNCGTDEYLEQQIQQDPSMLQRMEQIENLTKQYLQSGVNMRADVITIPVVVHVVYRTNSEYMTMARVLSQIAVLNEDFRKMNADASKFRAIFGPINADVQIEFCLATRDPNGNSTNGVTYTSTNKRSFSYNNDGIKFTSSGGHDAWPADQYLNIWVGNLSNGLLGYAQFPGGPASTDGVVIHYGAFGSIEDKPSNESWAMYTNQYDLGRTATHEVGHWLNLRHIWGDGGCSADDFIGDTPLAGNSNGGCPSPSTNSCTTSNDLPDMWENYMDYSYDKCMYAFTNGQSSRMRALFAPGGSRASLLNSAGCGGSSTPTCATPTGLGANSITNNSATLTWTAVSSATSYTLNINGFTTNVPQGTTSYNATGLTTCTDYSFTVVANCDGTSSSPSAAYAFKTTGCTTEPPTTCAAPTNLQTTPINPKKTRLSWDAVAGAVGYEVSIGGSTVYSSNTQLNVNTGDGAWSVRTDCGNGLFSAYAQSSTNARTSFVLSESFKIYPNPASHEVIIEFGNIEVPALNVILTDVLGRTVKQQLDINSENGYTFFDIQDLTDGIYFIQITDGEKLLKSSRVIVSK